MTGATSHGGSYGEHMVKKGRIADLVFSAHPLAASSILFIYTIIILLSTILHTPHFYQNCIGIIAKSQT